jgi:hypothetical protein
VQEMHLFFPPPICFYQPRRRDSRDSSCHPPVTNTALSLPSRSIPQASCLRFHTHTSDFLIVGPEPSVSRTWDRGSYGWRNWNTREPKTNPSKGTTVTISRVFSCCSSAYAWNQRTC